MPSGFRPAMIPSAPSAIERTASPSVTMESTTSEAAATARGVSPQRMPAAIKAAALSLLRFQPVTVCPAACRRGTIPWPITPRPTNPTFTCMLHIKSTALYRTIFPASCGSQVTKLLVREGRFAERRRAHYSGQATAQGIRDDARTRGRDRRGLHSPYFEDYREATERIGAFLMRPEVEARIEAAFFAVADPRLQQVLSDVLRS